MKKNPSEIVLTAPLQLAEGEGNALPAKFSGTAYSGGFVPGYGVVIDLATTTFAQKMPLLADHDHSAILGVINEGNVANGKLSVAGLLFSDMAGSRAEQIAQFAQRGMPFQMSVGLFGFNEMYVRAGASVQVNGQEFPGPVTVLSGGKVREVSVVALGADPNTEAQFFNAQFTTPQENSSMDLNALTARVAELTAELKTAKESTQSAIEAAVKAETARILAVEAQLIPGHEALILSLKSDGKSTGSDAAVAVLAAEKTLRGLHAKNLGADAPNPLALTPGATVLQAGEKKELTRAELDAKAKLHMKAHPGTDYLTAVKFIQEGA